jgi:thioredoxin 1
METKGKPKSLSEILNADKPALVDFSAEWCGPCKMMSPILKELKQLTGDQITVIKIDIDKNPSLASAFQIQSVPTLILFQKGEVKWRQSGVVQAKQLQSVIDKVAKI